MNTEIKREYKDTVFRMLFKDADNALSLYNGLSGSNYADTSQLEFNTLENAIYMNVKNDISFIIGDNLNLYEHQSTWNPNMPLRNLIYITSVYQNYVEMKQDKSIYGNSIISLPFPKFVVFYNGTDEHSEYSELKLSDSYIGRRSALDLTLLPLAEYRQNIVNEPSLELVVKVININPGKNEKLKERCPILKEYSIYVETVREYAKTMSLKNAVTKAVEECIKNNVLKHFLQQQKAEVIRMSIFEYDEEKELGRIRKEEREAGEEKGLIQGAVNTIVILKGLGISKQEIAAKLAEQFELTQTEAEQLVEKHWD